VQAGSRELLDDGREDLGRRRQVEDPVAARCARLVDLAQDLVEREVRER
jgi:hypothetical protein